MILGYKNKAKKFILLLIVPILFSNGLRFSLSTGILGVKEELYRIHRLLKDNAVKNDLIVSDYIPNSISIFASLNVPIKIITNKKILNKAKLFQADFFKNNFFVIDDFVITEDYPLEKYDRLWLITFDTKDLPELEWFFNKYAKNLLNTYIVDGCIIRLYTLK